MTLAWNQGDVVPVVALAAAAVAYTVYHYWGSAHFWQPRLNKESQATAQARATILQRFLGAAILGGTALGAGLAIGYNPLELGLGPGHTLWPTLVLPAGTLLILVPFILLSAKQPGQWEFYPRIRSRHWPPQLVRNNILSWIVYLVGYELLFRGLLVFPLVDAFGVWPGLAAMTAIYCIVHLPEASPGETLGTLPVGILFGATALLSGSMLGPLLAHIIIALTNDLAVIHFNPALSYERSD